MKLVLKDASIDEWEKAYQKDNTAAFSQSLAWNSIWAAMWSMELVPKLVYQNGTFLGLLPLAVRKRKLDSVNISGINGYGGLLNSAHVPELESGKMYTVLSQKLDTLSLLVNPFSNYKHNSVKRNTDATDCKYTIQFLDLRDGFDAQYKMWSKGHGSAAKKGMRDGVTVRRANSLEDWEAYFSVYQDSLRRWGAKATSNYPWELFDAMRKCGNPGIVLWLAEYQARIIAGSLCFYGHKHIAYWHGAALEEFFALKGPHVLQYHISKDAAESGYFWYDMLTAGGHEGVRKFKQGFAPETLELLVINKRADFFTYLSNIRNILPPPFHRPL